MDPGPKRCDRDSRIREPARDSRASLQQRTGRARRRRGLDRVDRRAGAGRLRRRDEPEPGMLDLSEQLTESCIACHMRYLDVGGDPANRCKP